MVSDKSIEQLGAEDFEALVSNGIPESLRLEFKEAAPGPTDGDKREFLADVSSLANASGGDLVYGVQEKRDDEGKPTGTAEAIVGIDGANADQLVQRLENILRDGITPRIPGLRFRVLGNFTRGPVLVIRVPQSWASPHMVSFQQSGKFFTRHSGGKHQLDVFELRNSFLNSQSAAARAREFRTERLGLIVGGAAPVALSSARVLCIHVVPDGALFGTIAADLEKASRMGSDFRPLDVSAWGSRFNIDGLIAVGPPNAKPPNGYIQLFRNGAIEVVYSDVYFEPPPDMKGHEAGVASGDVRNNLLEVFDRAQRLFQALEIPFPFSMFVSLHGMKNVVFHVDRWRFGRMTFDRETILLPEITIESPTDGRIALKPVFDALWQAAGLERCFDYAEDGSPAVIPR